MTESKHTALKGGLDLSDSPLDVYPGSIKDSLNYYEAISGGYTRIGGFERYDGGRKPSEESYYLARFSNWSTNTLPIVVDDDHTIGGMTMHFLADEGVDVDDVQTFIVCNFDEADIPLDLDITPELWDGTTYLISVDEAFDDNDDDDIAAQTLATEYARSQITAVPGDGAIAGVIQINGQVIAFRNNAGSPESYTATDGGWALNKKGQVIEVENYVVGDAIPGETLSSGDYEIMAICDWYDDAGVVDVTKAFFVIAPTGLDVDYVLGVGQTTDQNPETFDTVALTRPWSAWGTYIESVNNNFLSHPDDSAAWFCDGVNTLMSFSSKHSCVLPVVVDYRNTANSVATHVGVLGDELMWSTGGGTFVVSEPGNPFNYSGLYGAAETGAGDFITAMRDADGETMVVYTQNSAKKLAGTNTSDYRFVEVSGSTGAEPFGVQHLDDLYSFSSRGITQLSRTETVGGYSGGTISTPIADLIRPRSRALTASVASPSREQVRFYFEDGFFLVMTRVPTEKDGTRYAYGICYYPETTVRTISRGITSGGEEQMFFTSDTGYVYQSDVGTSFDGSPIQSLLDLHDNHLGSSGMNKRFKKVFWETKAKSGSALLDMGFRINYGEKSYEAKQITAEGSTSSFDSGLFGVALFDSVGAVRQKATLKGKGFSIGFVFDHLSSIAAEYTITGYTIHYSKLGRAKR